MEISVYKPSLTGNERKYVDDCIDSGWISSRGKYNDLFAEEFSRYIGTKFGTTVANGTLAVHLSLLVLGIGPKDEVIVPTFTYVASANAVKYTGADVVFADSRSDSWQIDPDDIERKITSRTKAIMPVHLYGHPCDMDPIMDIARRYGLFIVEDCAEAIGSEYKGQKVGSFGDVAAFSFFGNKTITCGEGGMVLTNSEATHEKAKKLKSQGLSSYREYWQDEIGYNFRMTNIAAAIGLAQLEQVERFVDRKIEIAAIYKENLKELPLKMHDPVGDVKHTYWMVSILCNRTEDRDMLREFLKKKGVETRPTFYPVHTMPMYNEKHFEFPNAQHIGLSGINLPSYPDLTNDEIIYVCNAIKEFFNTGNRAE